MYVQRRLLNKGKACWLKSFKSTLVVVASSTCGVSMWNTWWSKQDFNITCTRVGKDDLGMDINVRWEADCLISFRKHYTDSWMTEVTRIEAKRGKGLNKLRTYVLFKRDFRLEPYLTCVEDRNKRVLLCKFRIGICPLRIETGRYEQVSRNVRGLPEKARTCKCCIHASDMVENEHHFLLVCPAYQRERKALLDIACKKFNISSADLDNSIYDVNNLFTRIMESDDSEIINKTADYLDKAFFKRERLLL